MSVFFFVVGLEIKREVLIGELRSFRRAVSSFVAAFGGIPVWFAVRQSGVHATVAGVMMAFTIPCKSEIDGPYFMARMTRLLNRFADAESNSNEAHATIHSMEKLCEGVETPLNRLEHALQPRVSFLIMPLFALSNAGVPVVGNILAAATNRVAIGVALGLLLGKPFGITLFAWAADKIRLASRPRGTDWMQIFAASWVCGIGFTMSLFIASLALPEGGVLDLAKIGTLAASVIAGCAGCFFFLRMKRAPAR
jgi:NhaA family Na+:H+ antiporter